MDKPQEYKNAKYIDKVVSFEKRLRVMHTNLGTMSTEAATLIAQIQGDPGVPTGITTLGNQVETFFNHKTTTDFMAFVDANVDENP